MRRPVVAPWASSALALSCLLPPAAVAERRDRSVAACVTFDQRERADEDGVDLALASACEVPVRCAVRWRLTCAPGTRKQSSRRHAAAFTLQPGGQEVAEARATECGASGWELADIAWSCEPAP